MTRRAITESAPTIAESYGVELPEMGQRGTVDALARLPTAVLWEALGRISAEAEARPLDADDLAFYRALVDAIFGHVSEAAERVLPLVWDALESGRPRAWVAARAAWRTIPPRERAALAERTEPHYPLCDFTLERLAPRPKT